jgi:hypothetical protein
VRSKRLLRTAYMSRPRKLFHSVVVASLSCVGPSKQSAPSAFLGLSLLFLKNYLNNRSLYVQDACQRQALQPASFARVAGNSGFTRLLHHGKSFPCGTVRVRDRDAGASTLWKRLEFGFGIR